MKQQRSSEPAAVEPLETIPIEFILNTPKGVAVFPHFSEKPLSEGDLTNEGIQRLAATRTATLDGIRRWPEPHSYWGINE